MISLIRHRVALYVSLPSGQFLIVFAGFPFVSQRNSFVVPLGTQIVHEGQSSICVLGQLLKKITFLQGNEFIEALWGFSCISAMVVFGPDTHVADEAIPSVCGGNRPLNLGPLE
jgi:hypothetical protein